MCAIQWIPIDRTQLPVDRKKNFVDLTNAPTSVRTMLKNACYDCHSHEVRYPWYSKIAPMSWSIQHHIVEGRAHLNFSEWGQYTPEVQRTLMKQSIETLMDRTMPLPGYLPLHPEAQLTQEEREVLSQYFQNVIHMGK